MKIPRRQTKVFLSVAFAFLAALAGFQQGPRAEEKNFLWRVRSGDNTVYLLGSIHFLKKENYPLSRAVEEAYAGAQKVVLEIDLDGLDPEQAQRSMLMRGLYADGRTLGRTVSRDTFELTARRAEELGMNIQTLDRFKPWFAALTISTLKLQRLGFDQKYGVDRHFGERAKKDGKETLGLETFEYQIDLFDRMSPKGQEMMLLRTLNDLDRMESGVDRLVRSWQAGDSRTLETLVLQSLKEYPEVYQSLIHDRNRQWLPHIEVFLSRNESALVIVGAGHLVGAGGLVDLLKARGYAVEQL